MINGAVAVILIVSGIFLFGALRTFREQADRIERSKKTSKQARLSFPIPSTDEVIVANNLDTRQIDRFVRENKVLNTAIIVKNPAISSSKTSDPGGITQSPATNRTITETNDDRFMRYRRLGFSDEQIEELQRALSEGY
jgi:hypothetical protein